MDQIHFETMKIVAVLVLYNERLETSLTWNTLFSSSPMNVEWLIYNNGPHPVEIPEDCGIIYEENLSNGGLVPAYRAGLALAQQREATHLLLLDQDTSFPRNFWDLQIECIETFPEESVYVPTVFGERFLLSPNRFNRFTGFAKSVSETNLSNPLPLASHSCINSGALFTLAAFTLACNDRVDSLFLDNIDNAMTWFLWKNNVSVRWFHAQVRQSFSGDTVNPATDLPRFKIWKKDARQFGKITRCGLWQEYVILRRKLHYFIRSKNRNFLR